MIERRCEACRRLFEVLAAMVWNCHWCSGLYCDDCLSPHQVACKEIDAAIAAADSRARCVAVA